MGRYQKGKTNLDFTEARDSEWQWHQLGHMQVSTSLQADNHASTPPLSFFTGRMPFLPPNQQRQSTEGISAVNYCSSAEYSGIATTQCYSGTTGMSYYNCSIFSTQFFLFSYLFQIFHSHFQVFYFRFLDKNYDGMNRCTTTVRHTSTTLMAVITRRQLMTAKDTLLRLLRELLRYDKQPPRDTLL